MAASWIPDLSSRPLSVRVEGHVNLPADSLYDLWTGRMEAWAAAPGTLTTTVAEGGLYFFEAHHEGQRHPHYGRFLTLEPGRRVEMTWLTGASGTRGAETVVLVELAPEGEGTHVRITHRGFYDQESADAHRAGWETAFEALERAG